MATGDSEKERYQRYLCSREWGLLREQVRDRCGGVCERCRKAPMSHVHHLTYVRKYNERLDDLRGLCAPCHEFTHGKSNEDPLANATPTIRGVEINSVYLAGRISGGHGDWRGEIVPGWQVGGGATWWNALGCSGKWAAGRCDDDGLGDEDCVAVLPDGRKISYLGPYWLDIWGGHGGGVGPHARGVETGNPDKGEPDSATLHDPRQVVAESAVNIRAADLVFAWLDSPLAIGTIAEIGCAYGFADPFRRVVVACPRLERDLWFPCAMADRLIIADSAGAAWEELWNDPDRSLVLGGVMDEYHRSQPS